MDNLKFNINESLRWLLSGGVVILCYFFLNPCEFEKFTTGKEFSESLFLFFIVYVIGAIIYALYRALIYPALYKILFLILALCGIKEFKEKKKRWELIFCLLPFYPAKIEIDEDFRRWNERSQKDSFGKELLIWSSQVHFLYCSSLAIILTVIYAMLTTENDPPRLNYAWIISIVLFGAALFSHIRLLIYDVQTGEREGQRTRPTT